MSNPDKQWLKNNETWVSVPEAIHARRAVRHYTAKQVPEELLDQIIDLTLEAPSSWNLQDRHLVVVRSQEVLSALVEATGGQSQPREAPVMVVFIADLAAHKRDRSHIWRSASQNGAWSKEFIEFFTEASQHFQDDLERRGKVREYAIKDAVIAAAFFLLAATSYGLATCPMNGWEERLVKRALGIEDRDDLAVALMVSLGYANEAPKHPGRQNRRFSVFWEQMV
jgi:nitroreductase